MSRDVLADWPGVERALARAGELTGYHLVDVMPAGPAERLRDTVMAQLSVCNHPNSVHPGRQPTTTIRIK